MATFGLTAQYALRKLLGTNVISDIDAGFEALANDIDSKMVGYSEGPINSRPTSTSGTPGIKGRLYRATDEGRVYMDTGTSWVELAQLPLPRVEATSAYTAGPTFSQTTTQLASVSLTTRGGPVLVGLTGRATHGGVNGTFYTHTFGVVVDGTLAPEVLLSVSGSVNGMDVPGSAVMRPLFGLAAGSHTFALRCVAGLNATWALQNWRFWAIEL